MSKRKRQQCNSYSNEIRNVDIKEILDSKEYSKNEKRLLNKFNEKWQQTNYDNEDEVMKFSDEDNDEKDSIKSDVENIKKDFDLPDEKAWGKNKKSYYSTDYIDADYSTVNLKDIADAELEEQEARNLQKRLAEYLDEVDFGLDLIELKYLKCDKDDENIKPDLSKLNKRQKHELLKKENPEFIPLLTDFQVRLAEVKIILGPFLDLVKKINCKNCFTIQFIQTKYDLLLHYCINICFYLILKTKREVISTHPVIKKLSQYRQLLSQFEKYQENLLDKIKRILEANKIGQSLCSSMDSFKIVNKNKKIKKFSKNYKKIKNIDIFNDFMLDKDVNMKKNNTDKKSIIETEKRAITYEIAKNKGLIPNRKKEQRNPRVKHRIKYRKAKIYRKGTIREMRTEITKYGGEISGIKATVKKSIKLK